MTKLEPGTVICPPGSILWVAGKWPDTLDDTMEIQGVFSKEEWAVKACLGPTYFVAPLELNKEGPKEKTPWPGFYYPSERENPERIAKG